MRRRQRIAISNLRRDNESLPSLCRWWQLAAYQSKESGLINTSIYLISYSTPSTPRLGSPYASKIQLEIGCTFTSKVVNLEALRLRRASLQSNLPRLATIAGHNNPRRPLSTSHKSILHLPRPSEPLHYQLSCSSHGVRPMRQLYWIGS